MIRTIKKALLKIVGVDFVLEFVSDIVAKGIQTASGKLEADIFVHQIGKKIRNKLPGEQIEINIAHLLKSFKNGLLGKELPDFKLKEIRETEKEIEDDIKN